MAARLADLRPSANSGSILDAHYLSRLGVVGFGSGGHDIMPGAVETLVFRIVGQ
jgi:hypothetical protein